MQVRKHTFLAGTLSAVALAGGALAAVLTPAAPAATTASSGGTAFAAAHARMAGPAVISSPIGPITAAENNWLHTHPVNLTEYRGDAGYRASVLGRPAMKDTAVLDARRTFWGYFCAGYGTECLSTWGGAGGEVFFSSGVRGNANAEWNQWWFGQVGPSWPSPSTQFYTHFRGDSVYQYCYAPHGVGTAECITDAGGAGNPIRVEHATNSMDELFLWTASNHWVAALWTSDSFQNYYDRGITYWLTASQRSNGKPVYVSNNAYAGLTWGAWHGG